MSEQEYIDELNKALEPKDNKLDDIEYLAKLLLKRIEEYVKSQKVSSEKQQIVFEKTASVLDLCISDEQIGIPLRIARLLIGNNMWTVRELLNKDPKELLCIHKFGRKCLRIVKDKLAVHNLSLKE